MRDHTIGVDISKAHLAAFRLEDGAAQQFENSAAGSMIWMVFAELFTDALKNVKSDSAATAVARALTAMLAFQVLVLAH